MPRQNQIAQRKPNLYCYDGALPVKKRTDPHAIKLRVTKVDSKSFDKLPQGPSDKCATVRDMDTKKVYKVKRADCGLGCYCAAEAIPFTFRAKL